MAKLQCKDFKSLQPDLEQKNGQEILPVFVDLIGGGVVVVYPILRNHFDTYRQFPS
jgi:hypothetical protein